MMPAKHLVLSLALATMFTAHAEPEGVRTVFAHYMTCFGCSVEDYKRQMLIAQQYGVDGWALNCGCDYFLSSTPVAPHSLRR